MVSPGRNNYETALMKMKNDREGQVSNELPASMRRNVMKPVGDG